MLAAYYQWEFKMIEQCKGKDLAKVPTSKLIANGWIATIKYDGNYVQIEKQGDSVRFYTSGEKEFYIPEIAEYLIENNTCDFIIETEYIALTTGKLGSRVNCSTGSLRSQFEKGLAHGIVGQFKVFDIISYNNELLTEGYQDRLKILEGLQLGEHIQSAFTYGEIMTLDQAREAARLIVAQGWEGLYLKQYNHKYEPGKRVNTAIKLKMRPTADLLCIGVVEGEGKYVGQIGALILKDKVGRIVNVGSGLCDFSRGRDSSVFVGSVVEIEYEQILDTYIQPTFVCIREDKTAEDID